MKRILYVATVVKTHIMEFHIPYLKMMKEIGWQTAVAAKNDFENPSDCIIPYCDKYYDIPFERNPLHLRNIEAYKLLKKIIDEGSFDIIHCHTPVGGLITRLAANEARKKGSIVFYTAHGFHFYRGASFINWIVYYPIERWLAHKTDVLVTITSEDFQRGKKFKAKYVVYLPGVGIDLDRFTKEKLDDGNNLKAELGIPEDAKVFLSVGEVNANKNHKLVIECLPDFPNTWYVLCGQGPLLSDHRKLSDALGVGDRVVFTGYRTDIQKFYAIADVFVFPSLREGLPVALMEAIATENICVASRNRGTADLMNDSRLLFDAKDVNDLKTKLNIAMTEDCSNEVKKNKEHLQKFRLENALSLMKEYYLQYSSKKE